MLSADLIKVFQGWQEGRTPCGWWNYFEQSAKEVRKYQGIHNEGAVVSREGVEREANICEHVACIALGTFTVVVVIAMNNVFLSTHHLPITMLNTSCTLFHPIQ